MKLHMTSGVHIFLTALAVIIWTLLTHALTLCAGSSSPHPAKYDHGLCARLKQSVCVCVRACMR